MIAGKASSEILSMNIDMRCRWYKTLSPEEKARAIDIVKVEMKRKVSKAMMGNANALGCKHSEEVRQQWSVAAIRRWQDPEFRDRVSKNMTGKERSEETRRRISRAQYGEKNHNWQGGISFEPYCHLWTEELRESIRNRDNRVCVLCGKGEILNRQRLSVHHISGDKMMGCNGVPWCLCSLCRSCHMSKDTAEKEFLIVTGAAV